MKQTLTILLITRPRIPPPNRKRSAQIRLRHSFPTLCTNTSQQSHPITYTPLFQSKEKLTSCRPRQKLLHQLQIRPPLIRHLRRIPPRQARIMFNRIMLTQFGQIERIRPVASIEEVG